jgi:hypothetical protein
MTVGYRNSAGVDFDSLFDTYSTGTPPANTGLRTSGGVDLAGRYAPIAYGTKGPDVGYRTSGGVDVSNLWAQAGSAVYVQSDTGLASPIDDYQVALTGGTATATAQFHHNRNGTTDFSPPSSADNWILPGGSTVGDAYDVRYTQTASSGGGTVTGSALSTWLQLNTQRGLSLSISRTVFGSISASRTYTVEIRRRSDSVVLASFSVTLNVTAEIS